MVTVSSFYFAADMVSVLQGGTRAQVLGVENRKTSIDRDSGSSSKQLRPSSTMPLSALSTFTNLNSKLKSSMTH
jgi:hypothetical protein